MRNDKYALENTPRIEKRLLTSARDGLSWAEVKKRQEMFGKNEILPRNNNSFSSVLRRILRNGSLPLLLLGVIVLALRSPISAVCVAGLYTLYIGVLCWLSFFRSKETIALERALLPRVRVIREGSECCVSPEELVVGDLLILQTGDVLYSYAHLATDNSVKVLCRRGKEACIVEKYGGACFDTAREAHNFLAPGDVIREGTATAFVTEQADLGGETDFQSSTVKTQYAVSRMALRTATLMVLLLLMAAFLYSAVRGDHALLYYALSVAATLLAFTPADFIDLFCDVIFLKENRHLLRTKQAFLADLESAERLSEVDSYVLSTRSLHRSSRFSVRYFESGNGQRFVRGSRASSKELSLVCAAVKAIHEKEAFGWMEKNLLSYCRAHVSGGEKLRFHAVTAGDGFSLASFTNARTGRGFGILGCDAERLVEAASYVSEEGRVRILDAKTKSALISSIRNRKADGYHLFGYAETQKQGIEGEILGSFPDLKLLGIFVLSEIPDAKIPGALRELEAEGKKVFFLHDGEDPSWLQKEIPLLANVPVVDGGSPGFVDEIRIFATDPNFSFCIGVHLSPLQQAHVVHALAEAGHRVAAAGCSLSDHRMLCAASVAIVPLPDGKQDVSPIVRTSGAVCSKESLPSQIGCIKRATRLPGAFGIITSYLCASMICRVAVAALGFFFGFSLLSAFWYACLGMLLDITAVWILSHSRAEESHHIRDVLRHARERSVCLFLGSLCGALVVGCLSLTMAMLPARFDIEANAFLFVSLLLMLNVGLWCFVWEKGQTGLLKLSLLTAVLLASFFLLHFFSDGRYGAAFSPTVFFWSLIPIAVMIAVGKAVVYTLHKQNQS